MLYHFIIIHVDMDAFFASVEELYNPGLKGKPVIIGADPQDGMGRGVVSTANYEARKYGVHSAMPISKAYKLCPNGIYLKPDSKKYSEKSKAIMDILNSFSPMVEQVSVDEAFLDCSGCEALFGSSREIGIKIQETIFRQTGLTASIGIAKNKSLAKIASDYQKPKGLTIIEPGYEQAFLTPLPINKLWGIGKKTQEYLNSNGIYYVKDIINKRDFLEKKGKNGKHILNMALGIDDRPVVSSFHNNSMRKSISKEYTFHKDIIDRDKCENTICRLSDEIGTQLRKENLSGKRISIKIRLDNFDTFTRSLTISFYTNETRIIQNNCISLFRDFDNKNHKFRLLGVNISNLIKGNTHQSLLMKNYHDKQKKVDKVMDAIKDKFGKDLINRANLMKTDTLGKSGDS